MDCGCGIKSEKVGQVSVEEKDQILKIYNRKVALRELVAILQEESKKNNEVNNTLYEKVLEDISDTDQRYKTWWSSMANKYQWKSVKNGNWIINFNTGEITVNYPEVC